ncbi:MAG: peptidylprolyl isomerase [Fimbriimonadaceae bacterium]
MKNLLPLLALSALMSGVILTGCAKEAEPVAEGTATETPDANKPTAETPTEETKPDAPVAPDAPLADKPADGEEVAVLETGKGKIIVMFYPQVAPKTVENFKMLVKKGFYDGTRFHRCIPGFMVQGGDPQSKEMAKASMWGTGGNMDANGQEVNVPGETGMKLLHKRGVISMANSGSPDTASSQFFLMQQDYPSLDGGYSAFGKIVEGIEVVDEIVKTGSPNQADNGKVEPKDAVVLKKATMAKWPVK